MTSREEIDDLVKRHDEVIDHVCTLCRKRGEELEAKFYCGKCKKYLCLNCERVHQSLLSDHKVAGKLEMSRCLFEQCGQHHGKVIEYLCVTHQARCCVTCIFMNHRTCKNIQCIPKTAKKFSTCEETIDDAKATIANLQKVKADRENRTLFPDLDAIKAEPDEELVFKRIKFALEQGGIPRNEYINQCICKFGKKHDVVVKMCDVVSKHILRLSRKIKTVAASYIMTKPLEVVFVISHEDVVDTDLRIAVACYDAYFRNVECMSNEAEKVLYREDFQKDVLSRSQNLQVKGVINENSKQLFSEHSNLNVISASRFKSSGFMSAEEKILSETCIVLYVSIKGFIPLKEEPFQTSLGGYKTDVMEGDFLLHHKTAKDIHDDLKTGCQIHCPHSDSIGTIGPLVRMENKECFLTCSHVVCTPEELKIAKERGGKYELSLTECMPIYQPHYYDGSKAVGKVTQVIFKEGNTAGESGMDVAVVEITDKRPISGVFPDCTGSMWEEIGFRSNSELFYSGETCSGPDDIEPGSQAVMFGSQSGLSRGIVRTTAAAVRKKDFVINETPYTLYDQLEILEVVNSAGKPFAKEGDSGALVFMKRGNGPVVALWLFVGCTKSKQYIATPIWEIYRELRCMPLTLNDRPSLPSQSTMAVVTSQEFGNFRNEVRNEISGLTTKVNAVEETLSRNFQTLFSMLHGKAN